MAAGRAERFGPPTQRRIIARVCPALASTLAGRPAGRATYDACPGVLATHQAADGALARVRVPGGLLSAAAWQALSQASAALGDGGVQLTSRGNVEIRGLAAGAELALARTLAEHGLLAPASHERARAIVSSPLSGLDSRAGIDVSTAVAPLDAAIQGSGALAELSGRFLFGLDDGRGDIVALAPDLALAGARRATLVIDGLISTITVDWPDGPRLLAAAAEAFLAERAAGPAAGAWRIADLPDGAGRVAARLGARCGEAALSGASPPLGFVAALDGTFAVVVGAPFGRFSAAQASLLSEAGDQLRLTPWRSVVLPGLSAAQAARWSRQFRAAGLAVDNSSPWRSVTACTGAPGCAKSHADVRADARAAVQQDALGHKGIPVHWSGCQRRCGHPRTDFVDILATPSGYRTATPSGPQGALS